MGELTGYLGLFVAALGAATLLPFQSEAVLVGLLFTDRHLVWVLLLVATIGNTLGSAINWLLGLYFERLRHKRWFPASDAKLTKARRVYHRYGRWSLLLSWVPFIGDPLTVIAGIMREPFWSFLPIVALAKGARYIVIAVPFLH
jgi:membrane protein YqaA with SNARE-associated domain